MNRDSILYARIDEALPKAVLWLVEDEEHFKPETFVLYSYLERKFKARPVCNYDKDLIKMQLNERCFNAIYPFLRLVDPSVTITKERMSN